MKKLILLLTCVFALVSCGAYKSTLPLDPGESVNIGFGSIPKSSLTGSVSKLKLKDTDNTYSNIYDYIRGRVPGVMVGPDNKVVIRGIGSINSSNDPLYLVDGMEVNDISNINPADVESVEVIKDGTSAIYGVRGANGVIMITTKR